MPTSRVGSWLRSIDYRAEESCGFSTCSSIAKNEDGTIQRLVVGDDEDFGALLASIVPLDGAGLVGPPVGDGAPGFDPADAWALAESLLPGTALAFLLIEHSWAQPLFDAIAETGGALLGEGFLTSEAGLLVGAEVAAMEEAARGDRGRAGRRSPRHAPGHGGRVPRQPRRSPPRKRSAPPPPLTPSER